jgi:thiol-disulfide isomerase/thioredoxin
MSTEIDHDRRRLLSTAAMFMAVGQLGLTSYAMAQTPTFSGLPIEDAVPSFGGATTWLNSQPLTTSALRGKVVLVNFWTYTCINSLRVLPSIRAWAEKYKDQGLIVIGIQSPEFSFEKNIDNIRWAIHSMKINYPVAVDNEHAIWRAFNNEFWPALFFIDSRGRIRHHQFGEGDYEHSERVVQQLLVEAGARSLDHQLAPIDARGAEVAADWNSLKSPETYTGYDLTQGFEFPGGARLNKSRVYEYPTRLALNHWALQGDWTVGREAVALNSPDGRIAYRFHARDIHLVMGPAARESSVPFRVLIDGHPPGTSHGSDVDDQGNGTVTEQRLYQLIRQPQPVADRVFEIEFLESGVEAFDFTFG